MLGRWQREQVTLLAPALLAFKVAATLRRYVHFKRIAPAQGEKAFEQFLSMNLRLSHRRGIYPLAWQFAKQLNRPTAYDTAYLALAQLNGCEFWTADEKLHNAVISQLPWVNWIGNVGLAGTGHGGDPAT